MKKYRLKKWYPSLCKTWLTGTIVQKDKDGYYQSDYFHCNVNTNEDHLGIWWPEIENNPEFWEEVVEKTFEILTFRYYNDCYISGSDEYSLKKNGLFSLSDNDGVFDITDFKNAKIYSVKRLSDNEIFTIGDIIVDGINKYTITGFTLPNSEMNWVTLGVNFGNDIQNGFDLSYTKKFIKKEPIFVTEDDVEIFEGDFVYYVLSNLNLRNYKPTRDDRDLNNHYFSTEEKAREYIELNEKRYSINDIKGTCDYIIRNDWKFEKDTLLFYLTEN